MLKKIVSLTSFIAFICASFSSIVLYMAPHGHVAFWTDWTFLALDKGQWADIHITIGVFFCITLLFHASLNIGALLTAIQNKRREFVLVTTPMVLSCVLVAAVVAGTILHAQPMQTILDFSASLKEEKTLIRGTPPYGRAERSTLHAFCRAMGYDTKKSLVALKKAGYTKQLNPLAELVEIAHANGVSPQHIYQALKNEFPTAQARHQIATGHDEGEDMVSTTGQGPDSLRGQEGLHPPLAVGQKTQEKTTPKEAAKRRFSIVALLAALLGKHQ